jgi:glycosyltransferase involved in cell wall biosynthesis
VKTGLFINSKKANCSIYESGLMIYDILKESTHYTLDYIETDGKFLEYNALGKRAFDFNVINWHPYTLAVPQAMVIKLPARIAIVVEVGVSQREYTPLTPDMFDAYAIIDPTREKYGKYFPLPRPVLPAPTKPLLDENKLVLGSFGLYSEQFKHEKRFGEIVDAANNSGKECIVRINLPRPNYTATPIETIKRYGDWLKSLAKSNVDVRVTHDYMTREQLVGWLSEHHMNCFPYYRERAGLAAVADQAVAAGRAIMTTECNTFRHLHKYISHFPKQSYMELLETTPTGVLQMREDWSPDNFRKEFNSMLRERQIA